MEEKDNPEVLPILAPPLSGSPLAGCNPDLNRNPNSNPNSKPKPNPKFVGIFNELTS